MTTYDTYKDSGIAWLGQIPSHWEVKRLGSFFNERRQKVSDKDFEPLSVTKLGIFPQWENVAKTNDGDNRKLVRKGDFVINSRSDRKGSSGVSELDGSVSLINIVLSPKETVVPAFCNYLLKCNSFIEEYYRIGRGIVADLWTTRYQEMKCMDIAMPPLAEQEAIVNYLTNAIAKIDEAIAQQQKMIDLLKERKQIIINEAVTHGLDPNVPMKQTGIDWLPQIPAHWEFYPLKYSLSLKARVGWNGLKSDEFLVEGYSYLVTGQDFNGPNINWQNCYQIDKKRYDEDPYIQLSNGDLLVTKDGTIGKIAIVSNLDKPACLNSGIFVVKQKKGIFEPKFLYWQFLSCHFSEFFSYNSTGATIQHLYQNVFDNMPMLIPPLLEQKSIMRFIESNIHPINQEISRCERFIQLLNERKQIIINNVVTGKIKVV